MLERRGQISGGSVAATTTGRVEFKLKCYKLNMGMQLSEVVSCSLQCVMLRDDAEITYFVKHKDMRSLIITTLLRGA